MASQFVTLRISRTRQQATRGLGFPCPYPLFHLLPPELVQVEALQGTHSIRSLAMSQQRTSWWVLISLGCRSRIRQVIYSCNNTYTIYISLFIYLIIYSFILLLIYLFIYSNISCNCIYIYNYIILKPCKANTLPPQPRSSTPLLATPLNFRLLEGMTPKLRFQQTSVVMDADGRFELSLVPTSTKTPQTPGPSWTPLHTYKTYRSYSISEHPVYYCIFVSERLYCDPRRSHLSMSANTSNTSKTSTSVFIRGMDIYSWFVGLPWVTYLYSPTCLCTVSSARQGLVSMF